MVLQKRLDYGSSGYHIPAMPPHVPRSAKGKRSIRKKTEENPLCAFDLLAIVAGELLERENFDVPFITGGTSNSPSAKDCFQQEQLEKEQPCGAQVFDYLSSNKSTLGSQSLLNGQLKHTVKDYSSQIPYTASSHSLVLINTSDKEASCGKLIIDDTDGNVGQSLGMVQEKCDSPVSTEFCKYKLDDGIKTPLRAERRATGSMMDGIVPGMCSVEDLMDLDIKPPVLVSSDSSVEVPLYGDRIVAPRNTSFPNHGNGTKLNVNRDDDENSSGCTHPSTISKSYRTQHTGDRKIRKFLGSKYRKVATSMLNDGEFSDTEMKLVSRSRKMCYTRQRTQRGLFKRRKLFELCTISASDGAVLSEDTSSSPVKCHIKIEPNDSDETQHGANGASSSSTGQKSSYCSEDFQVKFSIKSFKVPELLLEIPENSTVGSLKRTVMEAVTALLGGGFRVGVLRQGKKVRDDTRTLLQAGISHGGQLDNLGFTLEPNPTKAPTPLTSPKDAQFFPSCKPAEPLTRIAAAVIPADQGASKAILHPQLTPAVNFPESDHDSVHSPADLLSLDNTAANSKALVPVPAISVEALAVVPMRKSRRSELVQRRIRRPFSVTEVEALVHAVEKLGTGRWRDVKLRAFDNAKHRTYVDLKDKWKTLVHTARISPQQRRGEPVPQELLDRVLAAHAYWSQQQAKLQVKSPPAESCLLT